MDHDPYSSFPQSPERRRQVGARGGRACARNRRARLRALPLRSAEPAPDLLPQETTAEAIAALNVQFPWLRGAEKRRRASMR